METKRPLYPGSQDSVTLSSDPSNAELNMLLGTENKRWKMIVNSLLSRYLSEEWSVGHFKASQEENNTIRVKKLAEEVEKSNHYKRKIRFDFCLENAEREVREQRGISQTQEWLWQGGSGNGCYWKEPIFSRIKNVNVPLRILGKQILPWESEAPLFSGLHWHF